MPPAMGWVGRGRFARFPGFARSFPHRGGLFWVELPSTMPPVEVFVAIRNRGPELERNLISS